MENNFDNLHPLLEEALRTKVKMMLRTVFELPLDALAVMDGLRQLGEDTGRFIDTEKTTECIKAQFVILEMLLDIMLPTEDADIADAEEDKARMLAHLEDAKKIILK